MCVSVERRCVGRCHGQVPEEFRGLSHRADGNERAEKGRGRGRDSGATLISFSKRVRIKELTYWSLHC